MMMMMMIIMIMIMIIGEGQERTQADRGQKPLCLQKAVHVVELFVMNRCRCAMTTQTLER